MADDGAPKKSPKKYKAMIAKKDTTNVGFPKPGDPYWKSHPLVTEHSDGTVRQWGEDTTKTKKTPVNLPAKKKDSFEGGQGNSGSCSMRYHQ